MEHHEQTQRITARALAGESLKQIGLDYDLGPDAVRNLLLRNGVSADDLLRSLPDPGQEATTNERDRAIARRAEAGEDLTAIARDYGFSRERARQIVARTSDFTAEELKAARATHRQQGRDARAEQRRAEIRQVAAQHPHATIAELADLCGTETGQVHAALDLTERNRRADARVYASTSDETIYAEMRRIAGLAPDQPLTGPTYDDHQQIGVTQNRILQRMGTWRAACLQAGVTPAAATRRTYTLRWTEEQMADWVWRYLSHDPNPSYARLDQWLRQQDGAPSAQTIRNTFGSWTNMRRAAAESRTGRSTVTAPHQP